MSAKEGLNCCLLNTDKAKEVFPQLPLNTNIIAIESIIKGNYHLRGKSKMSAKWKVVMDTIINDGFAKYAVRFRKMHFKTMAKIYRKRIINRFSK